MVILGLDIGKTRFDACLLDDGSKASGNFPNTEAGLGQLRVWLARRAPQQAAFHACTEAPGNYGLPLPAFLYAEGGTVSVVNPRLIRAYSSAELARNNTDKLDAALIARFCRTRNPPAWTPPARHLRGLHELVRRCAALKDHRTQEINRHKAGLACPAVLASIERAIVQLDTEIATITAETHALLVADPQRQRNFELSRTIPRIGNAAVRRVLYLGALSARRHNPGLADFVARMIQRGRPEKAVLVPFARKLLVMAHAVVRTQIAFQPYPTEPEPISP